MLQALQAFFGSAKKRKRPAEEGEQAGGEGAAGRSGMRPRPSPGGGEEEPGVAVRAPPPQPSAQQNGATTTTTTTTTTTSPAALHAPLGATITALKASHGLARGLPHGGAAGLQRPQPQPQQLAQWQQEQPQPPQQQRDAAQPRAPYPPPSSGLPPGPRPALIQAAPSAGVAKQLHPAFSSAVEPSTQQRAVRPVPSSSQQAFYHHHRQFPTHILDRRQYAEHVQASVAAEAARAPLHAALQAPVTIDLTGEHDPNLQEAARAEAARKELVEQARVRDQRAQLKMQQLMGEQAQSLAAARTAEQAHMLRTSAELAEKMRRHEAQRAAIQGHVRAPLAAPPPAAAAPPMLQPAAAKAAGQAAVVMQQRQQQQLQQQKQQRRAKPEVEEVVLLSSDDEEPLQAEEEQQEEGDEDDEDQQADEEEEEGQDEDRGWLAPESNTPAELAAWARVFGPGSLQEQLQLHERANIPLTREKLQCLGDGQWLNDEVINVSMALLQERDTAARQRGGPFPRCHFFNSFFLNKLFKDARAYSYKAVRRWTAPKSLARAGQASSCLLEVDRIIVPVHCGQTHWATAMVDLQHRQLFYWDSLRGSHNGVLDHLASWVADEALDKLGDAGAVWADVSTWPRVVPQDVPMQNNGSDCGVFAIKFAECAGTGRPFDFNCRHMPRIRRALAHKLLTLKM